MSTIDERTPPVVLSYGLGVDSTALLLRWIFEPETRPCALTDLLVITAMVGDEWPLTASLTEEHVLPLLRAHRIRYVQVARASSSRRDGISVLDDSRNPAHLFIAGAYRLQDELRAAGTVPQVGGARLCSIKAKGWPLDTFIAADTGGRPYVHVIGYEAGETARATRDARFNTSARTGSYPLIEWGWDRATCELYIRQRLGVEWAKSACRYCPYALMGRDGRQRVLAGYAASPETAVDGLIMERLAVSLNPAQGLIGGRRLGDLLTAEPKQGEVLRRFELQLDALPWSIYEVRRILRPRKDDPTRLANASRSVRALAHGSRAAALAELQRLAEECQLPVDSSDGVPRLWLRRRASCLPTAEWFWVAAPQGVHDKDGPGFATSWRSLIRPDPQPIVAGADRDA